MFNSFFHFTMFNITSVSQTHSAGATDSITSDNIVRYSGYAVGATAIVGSVGVMTVVAPAQMVAAAGITAGCHYAANRMRDGKSIIPSFGKDEAYVADAAVAA